MLPLFLISFMLLPLSDHHIKHVDHIQKYRDIHLSRSSVFVCQHAAAIILRPHFGFLQKHKLDRPLVFIPVAVQITLCKQKPRLTRPEHRRIHQGNHFFRFYNLSILLYRLADLPLLQILRQLKPK